MLTKTDMIDVVSCLIARTLSSEPSLGVGTAYESLVISLAVVASILLFICLLRWGCNFYQQQKEHPHGIRQSISLIMLQDSFYSQTPTEPGTPVAYYNNLIDMPMDSAAPTPATTPGSNGAAVEGLQLPMQQPQQRQPLLGIFPSAQAHPYRSSSAEREASDAVAGGSDSKSSAVKLLANGGNEAAAAAKLSLGPGAELPGKPRV